MIAAVPTNFNVFQRSDACGAGSTAHCCNDETAQAVTNHDGLSPDVGGIKNLLGQCSDITVAVIGGAVPIKNMCKQTAVCCGNMEQNVRQILSYFKCISTNNNILGRRQLRLHSYQR
jgi:hypothetical protein